MPIKSRRPLRAPVHFNEDCTLMVIPNLVEKTFGIQKQRPTKKWIGTCLIAQVAFTISSITGIKPMVISKHVLRNVGHSGHGDGGQNGYTLEEILRTFELPVLTRAGPIWLNLAVSAYDEPVGMIQAVMTGHPVITIIPREVCDVLENEAAAYKDGMVYATPIRPSLNHTYHSFLAIGYEVKSELSPTDFLILRDSRHEYCHSGYLKLGAQIVVDCFKAIRALSVDVLSVQR